MFAAHTRTLAGWEDADVNDDGASSFDALDGLDGLLAWTQARYVARTAATPLRRPPLGSMRPTARSSLAR